MADIRVTTQVVISALTTTTDVGQGSAYQVISPTARQVETTTDTNPNVDGHGIRPQSIADGALGLPGAPLGVQINFLWIRADKQVQVNYNEAAGATARVIKGREILLDCSDGDNYIMAVTVTAIEDNTEVRFYFAGFKITPA